MSELSMGIFRNKLWIERLVQKKLFWFIFIILGFSFPLYRSFNRELPAELPIYTHVPEFSLIDENGNSFGSQNMKGKAYLANFMFTSCSTVCPKLMEKMKTIQHRIRGLGDHIGILTFTVDPETDTSQKLLERSQELKANPIIWHFLTGDKAQLAALLIDGFKVPMGEKTQDVNLYDIAHTQKIVLVDGAGNIRGYYSAEDNDLHRLMIDLGLLVNREYFHSKEKSHG